MLGSENVVRTSALLRNKTKPKVPVPHLKGPQERLIVIKLARSMIKVEKECNTTDLSLLCELSFRMLNIIF